MRSMGLLRFELRTTRFLHEVSVEHSNQAELQARITIPDRLSFRFEKNAPDQTRTGDLMVAA